MILVIGIGNKYRNDDGVGLRVANILQERNVNGLVVEQEEGDGAALIDRWQDAYKVILIDAVRSTEKAGTIMRLDLNQNKLAPELFSRSTHSFGVAEAVELSRTLRSLPPSLMFYGIAGGDFGEGTLLSPEVENAAIAVANEINKKAGVGNAGLMRTKNNSVTDR